MLFCLLLFLFFVFFVCEWGCFNWWLVVFVWWFCVVIYVGGLCCGMVLFVVFVDDWCVGLSCVVVYVSVFLICLSIVCVVLLCGFVCSNSFSYFSCCVSIGMISVWMISCWFWFNGLKCMYVLMSVLSVSIMWVECVELFKGWYFCCSRLWIVILIKMFFSWWCCLW